MSGSYIVHKAIEVEALSKKVLKGFDKPAYWIVSPKYDGCHAVFLFEDGKCVAVLSRTGEQVKSMAHVAEELLKSYPALLACGKTAITGEAWAYGQDFNVTSGQFRKHSPVPTLRFVPFDYVEWSGDPSAPILACGVPYEQRIEALSKREGYWLFQPEGPSAVIKPSYIRLYGTLTDVLTSVTDYAKVKKHDTYAAFDGAIMARADGLYVAGAGKGGEFLKVKPLISYTVEVTGAECSKGEKTGKNTAALTFSLDGKAQKVSTGLTQDQVEDIVANGWVGTLIEVEAMGKTVNGYLREPRFKGIRTDA